MATNLKTEKRTWSGFVGRFILAFGDIENVTYLVLLHLPKDTIFDTASSLPFGKRIELMLELLRGTSSLIVP